MSQPGSLFRLDRDAETSPKRLIILAGVGVLLVLGALWAFSGDDAPVAPTSALPPAADPAQRELAARAITPAAPPQLAEQPAPAASAAGLELHGVMGFGGGGAAIIAVDGQQRLVRVGRDVLPGLPLESVAADHVILLERGIPVRLAFRDAPIGETPVAPTSGVIDPPGR